MRGASDAGPGDGRSRAALAGGARPLRPSQEGPSSSARPLHVSQSLPDCPALSARSLTRLFSFICLARPRLFSPLPFPLPFSFSLFNKELCIAHCVVLVPGSEQSEVKTQCLLVGCLLAFSPFLSISKVLGSLQPTVTLPSQHLLFPLSLLFLREPFFCKGPRVGLKSLFLSDFWKIAIKMSILS